jgi:hypothetical protein
MEDCSSIVTSPISRLLRRRRNGGGANGDGGNSSSGSGDFFELTIDGGVKNTYTEAFDPDIVCDPRIVGKITLCT